MADTHALVLGGCTPEPLGAYLKALGVLRLVAEQRDPDARGAWEREAFVLHSRLDREALITFFRDQWVPTPVVAPWNGGSGFWPKDNTAAADAILASDDARHAVFAETIRRARAHVASTGLEQQPDGAEKLAMLEWMRGNLPDAALRWIDAAVVVANNSMLFPPLLGTGGNDGRLDFSNNFQQRVIEVTTGKWNDLLIAALFGAPTTSKFQGSVGQFQPAADARTNPWDFVFLIEGAMLFVAAASRRLESDKARMAFPFHARAAGGAPTVADGDQEGSRGELWLPLWRAAADVDELKRLFSEGRATLGVGESARPAETSLDFARAITSLGVDRGIGAFARVGFHVRNGRSVFATPLGRVRTEEVSASRLQDEIDAWFARLRSKTSGKNAPASVALARRRLEAAMFDAVDSGRSTAILLALADVEKALARSLAFTLKSFLTPVPRLQPAWGEGVSNGTAEQRIAAALASRADARARMLPLDRECRRFAPQPLVEPVFTERPFVDNLHEWLRREDIEWARGTRVAAQASGPPRCGLSDIAAFIERRVDDSLIERWLRAFILLEAPPVLPQPARGRLPPSAYALLSLVHQQVVCGEKLQRTPAALLSALSGDARRASEAAARRVAAAGLVLPFRALDEPPWRMRRIAAALAVPISSAQRASLESILRVQQDVPTVEHSPEET